MQPVIQPTDTPSSPGSSSTQHTPTPKQQVVELLKRSQSVLLLTHENPDGDALGSVLATASVLTALGKTVSISLSGRLPSYLSFLPEFEAATQNKPSISKDILIAIDESQAGVGNVAVKRVSEKKILLVITPENGTLSPQNIRIEEGSYQLDAIISLDSSSLERTGEVFKNTPDLFYEVPVINIDHHIDNSHFGTVNMVDPTASSVCEMLVSLIETLGKDKPGLMNPDVATSLLTGIITDTSSFQNTNTTPKTLTTAAQLVAAGARQQQIVGEVYRARPLSTLRLWGRALAYLKEDAGLAFAWASVSKADFVASQASEHELGGIMDELLKTARGMRCVLLLSEREGSLHGSLRSLDASVNVQLIAERLGGGGHPMAAAFQIPDTTLAKENEIVSAVKGMLAGNSMTPFAVKEEIVEEGEQMLISDLTEGTDTVLEVADAAYDSPDVSSLQAMGSLEITSDSLSVREDNRYPKRFPVKEPQRPSRPLPPKPPMPVAKPGNTV